MPVTDRSSANDPVLAARIRTARFIYMLGGFPGHLGETLKGSLVWQAALTAYKEGAVLGGSSAGAMVMCGNYYDPYEGKVLEGLKLLPNSCVIPHHNSSGSSWAGRLAAQLPEDTLIGIDERTGLLNDSSGNWAVYGVGSVTLYRDGQITVHGRGETFQIFKDPSF